MISGMYAFYDYSSACWDLHLQAALKTLEESLELNDLVETLETFIESHWLHSAKELTVRDKTYKSISLLKAEDSYERIAQVLDWYHRMRQGNFGSAYKDDILDMRDVTSRIRSVLEASNLQSPTEDDLGKLKQFYGEHWFKCPHISCYYYYHGFISARLRDNHVNRHERPFLCLVAGCQMRTFGCTTEQELKRHVQGFHGLNMDSGEDYPPLPNAVERAQAERIFPCDICKENDKDKAFTRKTNLEAHIRAQHKKDRPFKCGHEKCEEAFARKSDCLRHQKTHIGKKFVCFGVLLNGATWGCKTAYSRAHKLADHFKTQRGIHCIRPHMQERLLASPEVDDGENIFVGEQGSHAEDLLMVGRALPSFGEFLKLCGLEKTLDDA